MESYFKDIRIHVVSERLRSWVQLREAPTNSVAILPWLIAAFQAAEDSPDAPLRGGSNTVAGSDSLRGSSLPWSKLREIRESLVHAGYGMCSIAGTWLDSFLFFAR